MKRFVDTLRYRDPWFRKLSLKAKALFGWLCDNCDNAGVIDTDLEAASFDLGESIDKSHIAEIASRLQVLPNGKVFIVKFIEFQYGRLSEKCLPHLRVLDLLKKHGIPYIHPDTKSTTLLCRVETTIKEKEEEKEEEKDPTKGGVGGYHKDARTVLHMLNEACGKKFREVDANLAIISQRLSEPDVTVDGMKLMIARQVKKWKGTEYNDYLQPSTLFGKTKFDGYYAAKDEQIYEINAGNTGKNWSRSKGTANEGVAQQYNLRKVQAERAIQDAKRPGACPDV